MAHEENSMMERGDVEKSMMKGTEEEDAEVVEIEDLRGLPIDGGWAYVVMIGEYKLYYIVQIDHTMQMHK